MKKNVMVVGMAIDMTEDGVQALKQKLQRDFIHTEVRIITGALFVQEVMVDRGKDGKQPYLLIGMGVQLTEKNAENIRTEMKKWLPNHEVKFIIGGLCATTLQVEVEAAPAHANGYL